MSIMNLIGDNIVIANDENLSVNDALDITCSKLIEQGKVEQSYLEAIKLNTKKSALTMC